MTTKIGWFLNTADSPWNELLYQKPEPLDLNRNNPAQYSRCPALAHYCKNTFVVKCAVDVELRFDADTKQIKYVGGSLDKGFVKEYIVQFPPSQWRDPNTPTFQFHIENGFVADEPVWVEVSQAWYNAPQLPGFVTPGTFDIYSWQRLLSYGFEWTDTSKNFKISRGDPLYHIRFRSKDPADSFTIMPIDFSEELKFAVAKCQGVKFPLQNYSWNIMKLNRLLRPRKFIK
jgi:hypothetical protein